MVDFYIKWEHELACLQLTLAMLGMGMTLRPRDFADVAKSPFSVVFILGGQLALASMLAIFISRVMGLPNGIAFGLIVMAAMPGGALSNIYAYLGRGNIPLSITATTSCQQIHRPEVGQQRQSDKPPQQVFLKHLRGPATLPTS